MARSPRPAALTVPELPDMPCSIAISHDGRHLFVVNTESKSISSYSIASDGSLILRDTTPVNAPTAQPADDWVSPACTTLRIVDSGDQVGQAEALREHGADVVVEDL